MSGPTGTKGVSGGLLEAMSCDVCSEVYEQTLRTPLVLPCGHTFCRQCLTAVKTSGSFLCPKCRANHNNSMVETLTINYSLLNILPHCNDSDLNCDKCATHGDDLRYWCTTCDLPLCSLCLYSGHPQGHIVKLTQTFVEEKKLMLVEKIKVIFSKIEVEKKEMSEKFNDLDGVVKQLFREATHLYDNEAAFSDLLEEIKKANGISSIMSFEKAVQELQSEENLTSLEDEVAEWKAEDSGDTPDKENNLSGNKEVLQGKAEDQEEPAGDEAVKEVPHLSMQQVLFWQIRRGLESRARAQFTGGLRGVCWGRNLASRRGFRRGGLVCNAHRGFYRGRRGAYWRRNSDSRVNDSSKPKLASDQSQQETQEIPRALIDYHDGRLLLHTLAEPATTRLSLQVPSEVFLELSVGGRCLRRVYISLWCHMRRAQQFLALCMGTLGPSLLGAKASEKLRNIIVFRSAVDKNNQLITNNVLTGLEWGGQHAKREIEGLVCGIDGSNNIAFGINTHDQANLTLNAPFGRVVAGLEGVKEALQHNPITEVTITRCGIVLPGLSQ